MVNKPVFIGSGAGFAGDRFDAAVPVIETLASCDGPRYLVYEVMAERTLAIAQRLKQDDPELGYSPWLDTYLPHVLANCKRHGIRIVANFGVANARHAARRVHAIAAEQGVSGLQIAIVEGDDLLASMSGQDVLDHPCIEGTEIANRELLAANAYLGAGSIAEALALDVDIVLVGRTTDAALVLGPLIYEFGWQSDAYDLLAAGTLAGHLIECGSQVSGGYFADPGLKDVEDLHTAGFPIARIDADGAIELTKAAETGGLLNRATVIEQILYEVHDPQNYLTPDVTLDMSEVEVRQLGEHHVSVSGARGTPPPATLKVTLSLDGGWLGEAEISYAGPNALARTRLAAEVVRKRSRLLGINDPCRIEILGTSTLHDDDGGSRVESLQHPVDGEYRLRVALRSAQRKTVKKLADEVLALFCCGPAGGGGVRQAVTPQVSTASILVDRERIEKHARAVLVENIA